VLHDDFRYPEFGYVRNGGCVPPLQALAVVNAVAAVRRLPALRRLPLRTHSRRSCYFQVISIQRSERWMWEMRNSSMWAVEGIGGAAHMPADAKRS
jgi:hypothetical protein